MQRLARRESSSVANGYETYVEGLAELWAGEQRVSRSPGP